MTTATTTRFTCSWCHTSAYAPSAMQPSFCTECVHAMLQGRDSERKAPEPTPADVTTRITFNRDTYDFDVFVTVEGLEIYLGSKPSYFDCESLCRQYRFDHYADSYTPEKAAAVAMEPTDEAPVDDGPGDNWGGFRCSCGVVEPTYATDRAASAAVTCPCGHPVTITVWTPSALHTLCSPCFERDFQCNENRTDDWKVLARVPPIPARFTCEICHISKIGTAFSQLRAHDTHAVCDDCRAKAAVRHSGAESTVSDDTSAVIFELALTDPAALREFLAGHSLYQRERLAWRFASHLKHEHGIVREPSLIARNWGNLIGSEEPQRAA